jgi:hypothetical protein
MYQVVVMAEQPTKGTPANSSRGNHWGCWVGWMYQVVAWVCRTCLLWVDSCGLG